MFLRLFYQLRLRLHDRVQQDGPALPPTPCAKTLDAPCCHRPGTLRMATRTADQVAMTWRPERPDGSRPHSRRHIARQRAQTLSAGLPSTGTVPPTSTMVPRSTQSGRHPRAKTRQPSRSAELI